MLIHTSVALMHVSCLLPLHLQAQLACVLLAAAAIVFDFDPNALAAVAIVAVQLVRRARRARRARGNLNPRLAVDFNTWWAAQTEDTCETCLRFTKTELLMLHQGLRVPPVIRLDNKTCVPGLKALVIVLLHLATAANQRDITHAFGYSQSMISRIITAFYRHHLPQAKRLTLFQHTNFIASRVPMYVAAISRVTGYSTNTFGFLDGTLRACANPTNGAHLRLYTGFIKRCAIKFMGANTPDGLLWLDGPYAGSAHDWNVYGQTPWHGELANINAAVRVLHPNLAPALYNLYGDAAFKAQGYICAPFDMRQLQGASRAQISSAMRFNAGMRRARVTVEWQFGQIVNSFQQVGFDYNNRYFQTKFMSDYVFAAYLLNCRTCIRGGNITSAYFGVAPPSLATYLAL